MTDGLAAASIPQRRTPSGASVVVRALARFVAALLVSTSPVAAADLEIVVDSDSDTIELFLTSRADRLVSVFDLPPEHLVDETGTVDFASLRQGTWEIGDALLSKAPATLDGRPIVFEAMSLMVHPLDRALPMTTPLEALLTINVCTVADPATPLGLGDLQGYVGYIAYVEDADGALALRLPKTGRGALRIAVRDFTAGRPGGHFAMTVPDGGVLEIGKAPGPPRLRSLILLLLGGIAAGVALLWWSRRTPLQPVAK